MHQREYALELISEVCLAASKPAITPIDVNIKLTSKQNDDCIGKAECSEEEDRLADQTSYQRLIGKLLYLTVTRPDIAFGVQTLSQFLQHPKRSHMEAALRIVKFVKSQLGQGILLSSTQNNTITAFYDADWATCPLTRKLVTGFLVKLVTP
ncbi:PREDICTED: uncharacterized protein LOC109227784 [Nicotiana attenuata]|uniref:uncharacterized protein LOC109227784 n=1 Tax=Nicotiana attenuata TaxID=49451 RepID=UPI000905463E|nr:PREDICTED: uncharacterized protein LOC109227784 [Nicotiana attenuata]